MTVRQAQIKEQAQDIDRQLRLLETTIKRLRKDDSIMTYNVALKTIPERYVASVRQVIPAYDQEYLLWQILNEETAQHPLQCAEPSYSLARFHDEGFKEHDVDVEIQVAIKGTYQDTAHVRFKTEPAVTVASATYKGSYEQLTAVNEVVANWVNDNGYAFDGVMFCIYHVSPAQTQDPNELVTEVCCPVKRK